MRKGLVVSAVILAIIAIVLLWSWPWDEEYDLGQLQPATPTPGMTYCSYTITNFDCEYPYYQKDSTICIECCVGRKPPWPKNTGLNNNCPKVIKFTSTDGTCEYTATRINQTCVSCPANYKGMYACPNP